jgi:bacterial/archaeal transporter family-2 protein
MSSATALAVSVSAAAGLAGAVQVAVMGRLGERVGTVEAVAFAGVVALVVSFAALVAARRSLAGYGAAAGAPVWMWAGGVLGTIVVFAITVAGPRIGVFATTAILVAAQFAAAAVIDRFGLIGLERIGFSSTRLAGLALLAVGAALALRR